MVRKNQFIHNVYPGEDLGARVERVAEDNNESVSGLYKQAMIEYLDTLD